MHLANDPTMLGIVFSGFVVANVLLMYDLYRHRSCPRCAHCAAVEQDRQDRRRDERHREYHAWDQEPCKGVTCKGYKKK